MKIAILTTDTLHHCYFVEQLAKQYDDISVFCETTSLKPAFETAHPFEAEREKYEANLWFDGKHPRLSDFTEVCESESLNSIGTKISDKKPDMTIIIGTSRLNQNILDICGEKKTLSLHAGLPEFYRGLDSHLWAIYHKDFKQLSTCIHAVNGKLDDGSIVEEKKIPIHKNMKLHELRAADTSVCIKLVSDAIDNRLNNGIMITRGQKTKGRYYSFMPTALKTICQTYFENYTSKIY